MDENSDKADTEIQSAIDMQKYDFVCRLLRIDYRYVLQQSSLIALTTGMW